MNWQGVTLNSEFLGNSILSGGSLNGADLDYADLENTDLTHVDVRNADWYAATCPDRSKITTADGTCLGQLDPLRGQPHYLGPCHPHPGFD